MKPETNGSTALGLLLHLLHWMVLIPIGVIAVARVVAWDSRSLLVGANALIPLVFLPVWSVLISAAIARRRALLVAAAVLAASHLAFALPEVMAASPVPAAVRTAPKLRMLSANVFAPNRDAGSYADAIRRQRPDVVVLVESSPDFVAALEGTGALADFPHRVAVPRSDPFGAMIASRWPLRDHDVVYVNGRPVLLRVTVATDKGDLRLFAVHAISPIAGRREEWIRDLDTMRRLAGEVKGPLVIAGDFNATWGNRAFRRLLDSGLKDAAAERGKPFDMTWSLTSRLPPLMRIDHVLTNDRVVVTRIETGDGRGSDHRPLTAELALLGP